MEYLVVVLFALSLAVPLVSFRAGLMLYLIGALLFPYLHIGGLAIRFELIYALWLLILLLFSRLAKRYPFRVPQTAIVYALFLAIVAFSTLIAFLEERGGKVFSSLVIFYGLMRPLLVLLLFYNARLDVKFVRKTLWVFVILSVPLNLFSIAQFLGIDAVERITEMFYISPSVRAPFDNLMAMFGRLARPMSVFESPVYNANYALMVILVCLAMLQHTRSTQFSRKSLYITGILSVIAGILTLSSTFLVGLVVLVGIVSWSYLRFPRRLFQMVRNAVVVITVAVLVFSFSPYLQDLARGGLAYQIKRITTFQIFETRYASKQGIFTGTYRTILENPILGRGVLKEEGAFVGDSVYIATTYMGGLIGLGIYLFLLFLILKRSNERRSLPGNVGMLNLLVFQMTILLLATGVGSPSFHIRRLSEWYWALVGMSLNRHIMESDQDERAQKN